MDRVSAVDVGHAHGIDAPEWQQPGGTAARQALARRTLGRPLTVIPIETDAYGRLVAELYDGTNWINAALVADGWAWHYRHHSRSRGLAAAERAAGAERAGNSFEVIAREWLANRDWVPGYLTKVEAWLANDVFPYLGAKAAADLTAPQFLAVARRVERRGAIESAHRITQVCGQVMRYAIATGRAERNPVADLRGALTPAPDRHFAAITDTAAIGGLLRAIDGYSGGFVTCCALQLAPLVFVRPGELRMAEWAEFDLDAAEWNIPADRMKTRQAHLVPLSDQAVAILRDLHALTGTGRYLFPGVRDRKRPMSNNTINAALRRMGFDSDTMTGHGFRAMARTVLDEVLGYRPDFIEHQLAHAVKDPNGRAYNRTSHLNERRKMMQGWADYLDTLKADDSNVVALRRKPA